MPPPRFHAPLVRDGRRAGHVLGLGSPLSRRVPGRHGRTELQARADGHFRRHGLPITLLELGRHEPGRDSGAGGNGLPHFLRRAGDLDLFRTTNKVAHFADDACAQSDEIARGQPIDFPIRVNGHGAQGTGRNDIGRGRCHEQPFRRPAPLAFLGQPHEAVR